MENETRRGLNQVDPQLNTETGQFILQLQKEAVLTVDRPVNYQGRRFLPKDEVHITIIGSELGEQLVAHANEAPNNFSRLQDAIQDIEWGYQLVDRWYHVQERKVKEGEEITAESIIRLADVDGIDEFYGILEEELQQQLEVPPTHVTLYTLNEPRGIGIATRAEFEKLVQAEIDPGDLQ